MPPLQVAPHAGGAKRGGHDGVHVGEPPFPHVATGEIAFLRFHQRHAARSQHAQVLLRGGVLVHVHVHGRRHHQRSRGGQGRRRQQVVGQAACQLRHHVGRAGGYDEGVALLRERHVVDGVARFVEQAHGHGLVGERAEGRRPHELRRMLGHDHLRAHARLLQATHHLARLVGGDAACHAHQHARALRPCRLAGRVRRLLALPDDLGQSAGRFRRPVQARPLVHATPFPSRGAPRRRAPSRGRGCGPGTARTRSPRRGAHGPPRAAGRSRTA